MTAYYNFNLREAPSDVAGMKVLGAFAGSSPVELDYEVPIGGALAIVDQFVCPAPLPNVALWGAGEWLVTLNVTQAQSISFTIEASRADSNGNDLAVIGSRPGTQTGPGTVSFSIAAEELDPTQNPALSVTDRVKLKLYAQNNDPSNVQTLGVLASASALATSIARPDTATNALNPFRRNKFLGFLWRRGDGARFFDKNGVNIDTGNGY